MIVRIIADDLTGALDTAAPFAALTGPLPVSWDRARRSGSYALDTETREHPTGERWVEHFQGADLAFKKVDSLLRGSTAREIVACLESGMFRSAIIAPAFPAQERITRDGRQHWRASPDRPWQPAEGDLLGALRATLAIEVARSPAAIGAHGFYLCDAEHEEDLRAIVAAGRRMAGPLLWCGSAGLARALVGTPAPPPAFTPRAPLLALIGSNHPTSRAQLAMLEARWPRMIAPLGSTDPDAIARAVAELADALGRGASTGLAIARPATSINAARAALHTGFGLLAERVPAPGSLFVTGGETLHGLLRALGARSLLATGELTAGIPLSRIVGGRWPDLTVISKSGGFGAPDLLIRLAESVMP